MSKNELAVTNSFTALSNFDLNAAMNEELNGLDMSFDRIKIPAAGSTIFEVPGEVLGETDAVKEFTGVILYHHPLYSFYREKYTGGNNPPDCGSYDGVTGTGNPGGICKNCLLNQFDSGENGGKACKNKRRVFLLRENEIFPLILTLPTGSMKEFGQYMKRLLGKGRKSNSVLTRFSLKKAVNAGGIAYSQAQFAMERPLTDEEYALISRMSEQVKAYSTRVGYEEEAEAEQHAIVDPETGEIIEPLR